MREILGFDAGTHGVRVLAFDPVRRAITASAGCDYSRVCAAGVQEMSPAALLETFRQALDAVLSKLPAGTAVEAIGVTHQRGTVIPVGKDLQALGAALCDSDSRAAGEEELAELDLDAAAYYRRTGCPFVSFNGMAKILWVRRHQPQLYARADAWLSPQDFLISHLVGRLAVTEGSAARNGYLAVAERTLAEELLPDAPFLRRGCFAVGESCGAVAEVWTRQFPALSGARVIAVPGDQPAAVIGAGAAASGDLAMNLGTTFVASLCRPCPAWDRDGMVTVEVLPQNGYALEFGTGAGGQFMDWLARMLAGDPGDSRFWKELDEQAAMTPRGAEGLRIVPLLWQVTSPGVGGRICGLAGHHTRGHLMRAAYEGLACEARLSIERVEACAGTAPETLRVFGGMSVNETFLQILASVTGKRVLAAEEKQASAYGAALTAALGCGYFQSTSQASALAENCCRQYLPERGNYDGFFEAYCKMR